MKTPNFWNTPSWWTPLLTPLTWLYRAGASIDRALKKGRCRALPRPTIVVGNISMGGSGKTPTTLALTRALQKEGFVVGILSRGYGRSSKELLIANSNSSAKMIGDEPLLLHQKSGAPLAVFHDRYRAGIALLEAYPEIDLLLCDDALQHYQLHADITLAVIGKQNFGNGLFFPAGPLRESPRSLNRVDYIINNGGDSERIRAVCDRPIIPLTTKIESAYHPIEEEYRPLNQLKGHYSAIAGIAYPDNFFSALKERGISITPYPFPDHHPYSEADLKRIPRPIVTTEKDYYNMQKLDLNDLWVIPLESELPAPFIDEIVAKIDQLKREI